MSEGYRDAARISAIGADALPILRKITVALAKEGYRVRPDMLNQVLDVDRLPSAKQEEERLPCGCKPEHLCECPENNDYSAYEDPQPDDQGEKEAMELAFKALAMKYRSAQWALDLIKKLEGELENAARAIDEERRARKEWVKSFEKADSANDKLLAENASLKEQLAESLEPFATKTILLTHGQQISELSRKVANLESKHAAERDAKRVICK